jgi:hypothetical protein
MRATQSTHQEIGGWRAEDQSRYVLRIMLGGGAGNGRAGRRDCSRRPRSRRLPRQARQQRERRRHNYRARPEGRQTGMFTLTEMIGSPV